MASPQQERERQEREVAGGLECCGQVFKTMAEYDTHQQTVHGVGGSASPTSGGGAQGGRREGGPGVPPGGARGRGPEGQAAPEMRGPARGNVPAEPGKPGEMEREERPGTPPRTGEREKAKEAAKKPGEERRNR